MHLVAEWIGKNRLVGAFTAPVAMGITAFAAILGICFLGGISYFSYGRRQTERLGVVGRMGRRKDLFQTQQQNSDECPHELNEDLPQEAAVVVPLFGKRLFTLNMSAWLFRCNTHIY